MDRHWGERRPEDEVGRGRSEEFAQHLAGLADALTSEYDVVDLFEQLIGTVVEVLPVSDAGLLLLDEQQRPTVVATTCEPARHLELFQLSDVDGGPCRACLDEGRHIAVSDLAARDHDWPQFAELALRFGYASVDALPLRLHGEVLGALNLFGTSPRSLTPGDVALAQLLADMGTMAIVQQLSASRASMVVRQLQHALEHRVVIEQAKGILAQYAQVEVADAFSALRSYARRHRRALLEVSTALSTHALDPAEVLCSSARDSDRRGADAGDTR